MPSLNKFCNMQSAALKRVIKEEASDSANMVHSNSDFSRSPKLSVLDLAAVACQTEDRSINRSLPILPDSLADVSLSAISQGRQKIKHSLYFNVFYRMNDLFSSEDDKAFHGWQLFEHDVLLKTLCGYTRRIHAVGIYYSLIDRLSSGSSRIRYFQPKRAEGLKRR